MSTNQIKNLRSAFAYDVNEDPATIQGPVRTEIDADIDGKDAIVKADAIGRIAALYNPGGEDVGFTDAAQLLNPGDTVNIVGAVFTATETSENVSISASIPQGVALSGTPNLTVRLRAAGSTVFIEPVSTYEITAEDVAAGHLLAPFVIEGLTVGVEYAVWIGQTLLPGGDVLRLTGISGFVNHNPTVTLRPELVNALDDLYLTPAQANDEAIATELTNINNELGRLNNDELNNLPIATNYVYSPDTVLTGNLVEDSEESFYHSLGLHLEFSNRAAVNALPIGMKFYLGTDEDRDQITLELLSTNDIGGTDGTTTQAQFRVDEGFDVLRTTFEDSIFGLAAVDPSNALFDTFYTREDIPSRHYLARETNNFELWRPTSELASSQDISTIEAEIRQRALGDIHFSDLEDVDTVQEISATTFNTLISSTDPDTVIGEQIFPRDTIPLSNAVLVEFEGSFEFHFLTIALPNVGIGDRIFIRIGPIGDVSAFFTIERTEAFTANVVRYSGTPSQELINEIRSADNVTEESISNFDIIDHYWFLGDGVISQAATHEGDPSFYLPGILNNFYRGTWNSGDTYRLNDLVSFNGILYRGVSATIAANITPGSDATSWEANGAVDSIGHTGTFGVVAFSGNTTFASGSVRLRPRDSAGEIIGSGVNVTIPDGTYTSSQIAEFMVAATYSDFFSQAFSYSDTTRNIAYVLLQIDDDSTNGSDVVTLTYFGGGETPAIQSTNADLMPLLPNNFNLLETSIVTDVNSNILGEFNPTGAGFSPAEVLTEGQLLTVDSTGEPRIATAQEVFDIIGTDTDDDDSLVTARVDSLFQQSSISSLFDVDFVGGEDTGELLQFTGSNWQNIAPSTVAADINIADLGDIPALPTDGDQLTILIYDRVAGTWAFGQQAVNVTNNITNNVSSFAAIDYFNITVNNIRYVARLFEINDGSTVTFTYNAIERNLTTDVVRELNQQSIANAAAFSALEADPTTIPFI